MMRRVKRFIKWFIPWMEVDKKIYRWYLKSHKLYYSKHIFMAYYYCHRITKKYDCIISPQSYIGKNLHLPHPMGVIVGAGVRVGDNVVIYQHVTLGTKNKDVSEFPVIGDNVTIYCNSVIVGNVTIGKNAVIGCNSVVLRDVQENEIVGGIVK